MKHFLYLALTLFSTYCSAQKFILVDRNMKLPVTYVNTITVLDRYKGYFPIDKSKINEFITEIEKIGRLGIIKSNCQVIMVNAKSLYSIENRLLICFIKGSTLEG
jgi:hypothetical protein